MAPPIELTHRRGTTVGHSTFTGAEAEITVDTDKYNAIVHDGVTQGGHPLLKEEDSYGVSVKSFGAKGDGVTNDSAAIEAGLNYQNNNNCTLFFPAGTYYMSNSSITLSLSRVVMKGESSESVTIKYDDSLNGSMNNAIGLLNLERADISGIKFESDWGESGNYSTISHMLVLRSASYSNSTSFGRESVSIENCEFNKIRYMSAIISGFKHVQVTNCRFIDCARDGVRAVSNRNVIVTNNFFRNVCDDAVAIHTQDPKMSFPVDTRYVVSGNILEDSQGIAILGGKKVTVNGNSITRPIVRGVFVGQRLGDFTEGGTPSFAISIQDNIITDVFRGTVFSPSGAGGAAEYIKLTSDFLEAGPASSKPNYPDSNGNFTEAIPYLYDNDVDASGTTHPGAFDVIVKGNVCKRTLTYGVNYTSYGYGQRKMKVDGLVDPTITRSDFGDRMIYFRGAFRNVILSDNVLNGGPDVGIYIDGFTADADVQIDNFVIKSNILFDMREGIFSKGRNHVTADSNIFDLDPYHNHPNRNNDGTWATDVTNSAGNVGIEVRVYPNSSVFAHGNTFKNMPSIYFGGSESDYNFKDNFVYAKVFGVNNPNNQGIRSFGVVDRHIIVSVDGNPNVSNYNITLNICYKEATSQPTSGWWPISYFVKNVSKSLSGSSVVLGWLRTTNGNNHVLGTDWKEITATLN